MFGSPWAQSAPPGERRKRLHCKAPDWHKMTLPASVEPSWAMRPIEPSSFPHDRYWIQTPGGGKTPPTSPPSKKIPTTIYLSNKEVGVKLKSSRADSEAILRIRFSETHLLRVREQLKRSEISRVLISVAVSTRGAQNVEGFVAGEKSRQGGTGKKWGNSRSRQLLPVNCSAEYLKCAFRRGIPDSLRLTATTQPQISP